MIITGGGRQEGRGVTHISSVSDQLINLTVTFRGGGGGEQGEGGSV